MIVLVTDDDLPTEVLTELGRMTWAAIRLNDYVEGVCAFVQPSDPRADRRHMPLCTQRRSSGSHRSSEPRSTTAG